MQGMDKPNLGSAYHDPAHTSIRARADNTYYIHAHSLLVLTKRTRSSEGREYVFKRIIKLVLNKFVSK